MSILTNLISILNTLTERLLQIAVDTLTSTPTPVEGAATIGVGLALVVLIAALIARFYPSESDTLGPDADQPWTYRDSGRVAAGIVTIGLYYLYADATHTVLGLLTAPFGSGDALLAALTVSPSFEVGPLMSVLVTGIGTTASLFAAALGTIRFTTIAVVTPLVFPPLTILALLRLRSPQPLYRRVLRRLRWVAYIGVVAVVMIQIGGTIAASATDMGLSIGAYLTAVMSMYMTAYITSRLIMYGPAIEQRLANYLRNPGTPRRVPDGNRAEGDSNGSSKPENERDRTSHREVEREFV